MRKSKEIKLTETLEKVYEKADLQTLAIIEKMLSGKTKSLKEGGKAESVKAAAEPQTSVIVRGRYQYSFTAKLHLSAEEGKAYYSRLKNALLSYGLKSRMSWANESFYAGRKTYAKLGFSGKKVVVYLALDPKNYAESKYYFKDVSEKAKYAAVPMAVSVKSTRGLKWAEELIAILAEGAGKGKSEWKEEDFRLPAVSLAKLIAKGLVKETARFSGFSSQETAETMEEVAVTDGEIEISLDEKTPNKNGRVLLKRKDRKK